MSTDKQVILDVDPAQVMVSREKASSAWSGRWRLCMALLAVALCIAAAVFFTFNKMQSKPDETDDVRLSLRQVSASAKAAIHLTGHYNPKFTDSVEWRDSQGQAFKHGGLKLLNNQIHIPHNGYYFVYSQASYRVSCSSSDDDESGDEDMVHLSHMVQRYSSSYAGTRPLLSAVRTACKKAPLEPEEDDGQEWFTAIYVGAVFKLDAGDHLYTEMMGKMLPKVESEDGKTFFGVFAL